MAIKRTLLVGASALAIGTAAIGTIGAASALTSTDSSGTSLAQKLAERLGLNQTEVESFLNEDREAREAERKAEAAQALTDAVTAGTLTQAQADYITTARAEIEALRGDTNPRELTDDVREQIRTKMGALRTWAEENDIDQELVHVGGHGPGGPGGPRGERPTDSETDTSDNSTSSDT